MSSKLSALRIADTYDENLTTIAKLNSTMTAHVMLGYWKIGTLINAMQENEGKYGARIMERVSEDLAKTGHNVGKRILQEAARFRKIYPTEHQVITLCKNGLTWSHARCISSVKDKAQREELVDEIIDQGLSARVVSDKINKLTQKAKPVAKTLKVKPAEEPEPVTEVLAAPSTVVEEAADATGVDETAISGIHSVLATSKRIFDVTENMLSLVASSSDTLNKSIAKAFTDDTPDTDFANIAGASPQIVKQVQETVEHLHNIADAMEKDLADTLASVQWFAQVEG